MNDQSYYCVIPSALIADPSVSMAAKLAYGIITSLARREGYAWVSNETLAMMVGGRSSRMGSRWVGELEQAGYLSVDGRGEGERRLYITIPSQECPRGSDKNVLGGVTKMAPNNTRDSSKDKDYETPSRETPTGLAPWDGPVVLDPLGWEEAEPPRQLPIQLPIQVSFGPSVGMKAKGVIEEEKSALEKKLAAKFLDLQPDKKYPKAAYAKERLGVKRLVEEAFTRQPEDPEGWVGKYLATFLGKKERREPLFKDQPLTPSVMSSAGLMQRVVVDMAVKAPDHADEELPF